VPQCCFGAPQQLRALFWADAVFPTQDHIANIRNEIKGGLRFKAVGIAFA
jgi:hypothetical protein